MNLFGNDIQASGATFDSSETHRFVLWRSWAEQERGKMVMFIGLNPSTANQTKDDPTIRRVMGMAKSWGYNGIYMLNLFSFVSAYPEKIPHLELMHGKNMHYLRQSASLSDKIVFAWGNFKKAQIAGRHVTEMFPDAYALHINKNGSPKHPLYVKKDVQLIKFNQT
jgi:hypothetical protein